MFLKSFTVAFFAALTCATVADAQGRPPAESPPAGYAGQQYIDSRGCTYIRAGHGGQVNWVARIDRARQPICGQPPSLSTMAAARDSLAATEPLQAAPTRQAAIAPAQYVPPPVSYGKPRPLAVAPVPAAPRAAAPVPPRPMRVAGGSAPPATLGGHPTMVDRRVGCPAQTPYGVWYELQDGRRTLLCSNQPHSLEGVTPVAPPGAGQIYGDHGQRPGHVQGGGYADPVMTRGNGYRPSYPQQAGLMTPPPGYKAAWQDDRLNPNRGPRTAQGEQSMDQVWTRQSPQVLRDPVYAQPAQAQVRVSSRNMVPPQVAGAARFVQVGSFADPRNASRVVSRLQSMGMPVQVGRTTLRGKPVQVVSAGPFGDAASAGQARSALRAAGYSDAVLRR